MKKFITISLLLFVALSSTAQKKKSSLKNIIIPYIILQKLTGTNMKIYLNKK